MDRVAVFVDAGYLFAQGSVLVGGQRLQRSRVSLNIESVIQELENFATKVAGVGLLRIYWYDGTSTGPTLQHIALGHATGVKVRLGLVNRQGEQKGVDSLIVTDMIALARNRAISDAVLLSGDEDLRVGVQQAQEFGVRVHLLGIQPSRGSQSLLLLQEADTTCEWGKNDLASFLVCKEPASSNVPETMEATPQATSTANVLPPLPDAGTADPLSRIALACAGQVSDSEIWPLIDSIRGSGQIPRELDALLLAKSRTVIGKLLDQDQKNALRTAFLEALKNRASQRS